MTPAGGNNHCVKSLANTIMIVCLYLTTSIVCAHVLHTCFVVGSTVTACDNNTYSTWEENYTAETYHCGKGLHCKTRIVVLINKDLCYASVPLSILPSHLLHNHNLSLSCATKHLLKTTMTFAVLLREQSHSCCVYS